MQAGEAALQDGGPRLLAVVADLATELDQCKPGSMGEVVEQLQSADARLGNVTTQPALVLESAPAFPLVGAALLMCESDGLSLQHFARRCSKSSFALQPGLLPHGASLSLRINRIPDFSHPALLGFTLTSKSHFW